MSETIITPAAPGPLWQRIVLTILGVYGVAMLFVTPAGWPSVGVSGILLVLAGAVALSAQGNTRYKQIVLTGLAVLLGLAFVSFAWS